MSSSLALPNIAGSPAGIVKRDPVQAPDHKPLQGLEGKTSFNKILGSELAQPITEPLKFSAHASARMQSRNLAMGPEQMQKLNEAINKAAAKGLDDTLILTKDSAFIVSVKNRTVVTAMDRASLDAGSNVFTNIDGAVIV